MTRLIEERYGTEAILKVLAHPNGTTLYRATNPFGSVEWYTTEAEALARGLEAWTFGLGTFKRNCAGRRTAAKMVSIFEGAMKETHGTL